MSARSYPPERVERYINALRDADPYALVERRDDLTRLALSVMAVADAETDPVYRSGYDTGVMHAGGGRIAAERNCLAMAVHFALQWKPDAPMGLREGIEEILATMPDVGEKSSPTGADATPNNVDVARRAHLLADMTKVGGRWKSGTVAHWYEPNGYTGLGVRAARQDLAVLRDAGAVVQHDDKGVRWFSVARSGGDRG
ncbi:hypothetical protein RKD37_001710 [Streptomyces ambofaciens]